MRRCVLHIGMNKAGSTTIQARLCEYREPGVEVLTVPRRSHTYLLCVGFRQRPPVHILPDRDPAAIALARQDARDLLARALGDTERSVILSSEFLSDSAPAEVADLVGFLRGHVDEVRVIGYVRDPGGYMRSILQENLKVRLPPDEMGGSWPRYRARLAPWDEVMAPGRADLVAFDRDRFAGGDLLADFAARAGLADGFAAKGGAVANASLSAEATAVLYAFRAVHGGAPVEPGPRRRQMRMIQALKGFGRGRFAYGEAAVARAVAARRGDLDWIEVRLGHPFGTESATADYRLDRPSDLAGIAAGLVPDLRDWAANVVQGSDAARENDPASILAAVLRDLPPEEGWP